MWRRLLTLPMRKYRHTIIEPLKRIISLNPHGLFLLMNTAQIMNIDFPEELKTSNKLSIEDLNTYFCELKQVNLKNDEAMRNLIKTLNACIEEICEQYQQCVARQIEITMMCMSMEPVGKHWDDLTRYRVEADDLKREFEKYSMLVDRIGQIIYAAEASQEHTKAASLDYENLKNLIKLKNDENVYWDGKLLDVNKQSILTGAY